MGSPCGLGVDHSLGQNTGEAPARCMGLIGWPLGCRVVSLVLFSRTEGYVWALVIPFGLYCGLFSFEETIRWGCAHTSAPTGCSS
jgi:hypothetical protein